MRYAARAGDRALAQLAHDEAVAHYRQALELLGLAGGDEERRLDLLIRLGEAGRRAGDVVRHPLHAGGATAALVQCAIPAGNARLLPAVRGERMGEQLLDGPVTILFSDVEGSTDLRTERGDAVAHRILRAHEEVVRSCVAAYDGREIKALGDGFMLAFASVRKALTCAVAIQVGLAERNADSPGDEVQVRIGINTGEVVVEGDDLYGQAVNAAARIASRAKGGEILVSEIVRQLAGSGPEFTFVDRGRYRLKGFPERWHLYGLAYDAAQPTSAASAFAERTPFVGREAERAEFRRLMAQTKSGTGALVMVGGEPGVGKSRLAEELRQRCEADGFVTYVGHCYEAAGAPPYIPIVEVYEQALAAASSPEAFRQFLGDEASEVARLVPKLRRLCPDIPPPLELPPEQERRYLFNSVFDVLARSAATRPTLLVLDDIHWADEPTMLLLAHVAERIAEIPVLMVGLYRDSEVDAGRPLSRTFEELTRRRLARRMRLERLPADGVAQMLTGLAGQSPPPELVKVFYAETDGNPFFTEEVFRHLAEEGRLFEADGRFRADLKAGDLDVPEGVRLVVAARLRRLGDDGTKVLGSAAVIGRVFSLQLLQAVEELPEMQLLDIVEEAERARLIAAVENGTGEDTFIFGHELIRQTVLGELSAARRRRLHARAAEALERHHAAALAPQAAAIANHLLEAGPAAEPKRTFRALVMAGRFALETSAFEEALRHLERAAERGDAATPVERAELLDLRGSAERSAGHWPEAIPLLHQAVDAYEALGDDEAVGRVGLQAAYSLLWAGRWGESVELAERALAVLGDEVTADRAQLLAHTGAVLHCGEAPFEVGEERLRQGLAIADQLGDAIVRGHCLHFLCISRFALMHQTECAEAGLEAAELLRAAGDLWGVASALGWTTIALVDIGRFADALSIQAEHEPLCERLGNHAALMQARRVRTMVDFCTAPDLAALEAYAHADVEFVRGAGLPWFVHAIDWIGLARFLAGDWDAARAPFEEAVALDPPSALNGFTWALLFEYLAYTGDREAALALLDKVDDNRLPKAGQPNGWGPWMMLLSAVEGLYVLGDRDRAAGFYDLVVECIERTRAICPNYNDMRLLQRTAGIAAAAGHGWDDAEEHFRTALRQAAELPHLPEAAHTRRFFATMLLERDGPGDRAEAAVLIDEARELYRSMGMPKHAAMMDALGN